MTMPAPKVDELLKSIYVTAPLCGRIHAKDDGQEGAKFRSCGLRANVPCHLCLLVVYCSNECRRASWAKHKPECGTYQRIIAGRHDPNKNYDQCTEFWGGYAAVDLFNLAHNEGPQFEGRLRILLTGEFSFRHFIYSVNRLPPHSKVSFELVISQPPGIHLIRTVFALALLLPEPQEQTNGMRRLQYAEAAIHLLYSMNVSAEMVQLVQRRFSPNFSQCGKAAFQSCDPTALLPNRQICTFNGSNWSLVFDLPPGCFDYLLHHINCSSLPPPETCRLMRVQDIRNESESYPNAEARMTPNRFACFSKWRCDGMLLPYGASRSHIFLPNPAFFSKLNPYPAGASSEPLTEWPAMELLEDGFNDAKNDVYGKMFYYLQQQFVDFQKIMGNTQKIVYSQIDVNAIPLFDLPQYLNEAKISTGFDRIEAGDWFDDDPQITLATFSRLLRHEYMNPCASAVSITRNFARKPELKLLWEPAGGPVDDYAKPMDRHQMNTDGLRQRILALLAFDDWDLIAESSLRSQNYFTLTATKKIPSIVFNDFMGIRRRIRPRVIPQPWPYRLVWNHRSDRPDMRDFKRWIGWARPDVQLWLEWRKVADTSRQEYLKWTGSYGENDPAQAPSIWKDSSSEGEPPSILDSDVHSGVQWIDAKEFFEEEDKKAAVADIDFSFLGKESDKTDLKSSKEKKGKGKQKSRK